MTLTTTTTTTGSQENKETMQARGAAIQNSNPDAILIMSTLDQQPPSCLLEGVPFWFQLAVSLLITFVGTPLEQVGVYVPSFAALVRSSPPMFTAKPSWGVRGILSKMQQTCDEHVWTTAISWPVAIRNLAVLICCHFPTAKWRRATGNRHTGPSSAGTLQALAWMERHHVTTCMDPKPICSIL